MVTILMVYASGVKRMLDVTMKALIRHDAGHSFWTTIITDARDVEAYSEAQDWAAEADIISYDVGVAKTGSGQHGRLLDRALANVGTKYFLTLDSDCFPVADGWLQALVDMQEQEGNVAASGILWPWIPAPETENKNTIEWRVRRYQCWLNTQPACQLVRTELMARKGWRFADPDGDDTNAGFMEKAHAEGMTVVGWMPTRGPLPDADADFNPEMNRHESLIFGDMMYHHVGATRECRGETEGKSEIFSTARDRVYAEEGAEWMLEPGNSHVFKMDREEVVAQVKMGMFYETATRFLETHGSLFGKDWA